MDERYVNAGVKPAGPVVLVMLAIGLLEKLANDEEVETCNVQVLPELFQE